MGPIETNNKLLKMYCFANLMSFLTLFTIVLSEESNDENENKSVVKMVEWKDCGGINATVRFEDVRIPEPMRIKNLLVGGQYRISEEVKPGSYSKIEVWRIMKVLFVPVHVKIPCTHKLGSCQYDLCEVSDIDNFCIFQRQHTDNCGCPMSPKLVEGYNFKVRIPDKISTFQTLFAEVFTINNLSCLFK